MKMRIAIVGASLAVALASAIPAAAVTITMDPDGNPATVNDVTIDSFDLKFGNGIAVGLDSGSAAGDDGTFLFQANLNTGDLGGVTQFVSCFAGSDCFTIVAAISETVTSNVGGTLSFAFDPTGPNYFRIYATDAQQGDNLTGDCFANGVGCVPKTLVLEGSFLNDGSFSSAFVHDGTPPVVLDQANDNDYPGILSLGGNGSFQANIDTWTFINPLYFPAGLPATLFFDGSSQNSLPFDIVDPSACFSSDGITGGSTGAFAGTATPCANQSGVGTVGAVNAVSGPNTMLQNHAGLSFEAAVPEPLTLTLLGFGLVVAAARLRRR